MYVPLHRFWTTGPFFSALWQKYSSTVVQTAFYLSIGGVWERLFIGESKFNFHFHKLMKKIILFVKKNQGRQNCILGVKRKVFGEKHFFEKSKFLNNFFPWPKKGQFLGKKIRRICGNCILLVEGNVLRKSILVNRLNFSDHFRTLSWKIPEKRQKNFSTYGKSAFYVYRRTVRWLVFGRKDSLHNFLTFFAQNCPKLAANFLVKLSVIQSECPREQFEGSYFL